MFVSLQMYVLYQMFNNTFNLICCLLVVSLLKVIFVLHLHIHLHLMVQPEKTATNSEWKSRFEKFWRSRSKSHLLLFVSLKLLFSLWCRSTWIISIHLEELWVSIGECRSQEVGVSAGESKTQQFRLRLKKVTCHQVLHFMGKKLKRKLWKILHLWRLWSQKENIWKSYIFDGNQSGLKLIVSEGGGADCHGQPEKRLVISVMEIILIVSMKLVLIASTMIILTSDNNGDDW